MQQRRLAKAGLLAGLVASGLTGFTAMYAPAQAAQNSLSDGIASALRGSQKFNVLFIAVDDLRTQLRCYGSADMISPNIDRIAREGLLFENAYCQQAVCAPSRSSLLSGLRPDSTHIYNLKTPLRSVLPEITTLPQVFKENGYETVSIGKIYHHPQDDLQGWSGPPYRSAKPTYLTPESLLITRQRAKTGQKGFIPGVPFEAPDVPDESYNDGSNTDYALRELRRLKSQAQPFFLAMGFQKPHLPFNAPKKYWDLYQPEKLPLAGNPSAPTAVTPYSLTDFGELRTYYGVPQTGPVPDDLARKLVHGYHACVSYTDAQIGRLLDELDRLQLRDRTIVVLWGDHGWKLGEHGSWCKHTNFENDTHAPLLVSAPGLPQGLRTKALVEFVDIYPSLCELCRLPKPDNLEGASFVPLLTKPDQSWKAAAFSQYPRGRVMGYTMTTGAFRYTEWQDRHTGKVMAAELYDHRNDSAENHNVVAQPEYAATVAKLCKMLRDGWQKALPLNK